MAISRPATDRPRQLPKRRIWPRLFSFVSVGAISLSAVAALSLWLLMTDPVIAGAVMERGDLLPVVAALAKLVGEAFAAVLALL